MAAYRFGPIPLLQKPDGPAMDRGHNEVIQTNMQVGKL